MTEGKDMDERITKMIADERARAAEYEQHADMLQKLIESRVDLLGAAFTADEQYRALRAGVAALTIRAVDARDEAHRLEKLIAPLETVIVGSGAVALVR